MYSIVVVVALLAGVVASSVVPQSPLEGDECFKLQEAYNEIGQLADDALMPCHVKKGRGSCLIFGSMFVSSFRKTVSKISADLMCTEMSGRMQLPEACELLSSVGELATKDLKSIFASSKTSPMAAMAEEIIPLFSKMSYALTSDVKDSVCSFL